MGKVGLVAVVIAVASFLVTVGIVGAQMASPSPSESPSATASPTASPTTTVPSGAPSTGFGGY